MSSELRNKQSAVFMSVLTEAPHDNCMHSIVSCMLRFLCPADEHVKAIELCNCHLLRRPRGAAEFDPRYPWGIYKLDLSNPSERVVAVQLAEVCYSADRTEPGDSVWMSATVDGRKFKLSLVEPKPTKKVQEEDEEEVKLKTVMKDFNLPEAGLLKVLASQVCPWSICMPWNNNRGGLQSLFAGTLGKKQRADFGAALFPPDLQFELKQTHLSTINKGETPVSDGVLEVMKPYY